MAPFERLHEKYRDRDVAFLVVYTREQHPGEKGYRGYTQHADWAQKLCCARELTHQYRMSIPVLVDRMDERVHETYGGLPNMLYLIDKGGKIAFKATWAQADQVEQVLERLLTQENGQPGQEAIARP